MVLLRSSYEISAWSHLASLLHIFLKILGHWVKYLVTILKRIVTLNLWLILVPYKNLCYSRKFSVSTVSYNEVILERPSWHNSVGRASEVSHYEGQHDRSWFQAPPMLACRYMEGNSSAAMLASKRSASAAPEVNIRECVTCMTSPSANKEMSPRGDVTRSLKQGYQ